MVLNIIKRSLGYLTLISLLAFILIVLSMGKNLKMNIHMLMMQSWFVSSMEHEMKPSCINVTGNMVLGSWQNDKLKQGELAAIENFHKKIWTYHGIPLNLQHKDKLCGNVTLRGITTRGTNTFKALCDPNGSTPCCFENKCVLKTVEECRCKNCYDLRQKLHAELSTWIPADPTCKVTTFAGEEDSCKVLGNMTIYFIGDSFMRQLYISVLSIVRKNNPHGPLINQAPADKAQLCDAHYVQTAECSHLVNGSAMECNNTTRLRSFVFWGGGQINQTLKDIQELKGQPNSVVIFSIGIHFRFNFSYIENQILNPLLLNLGRFPWPKLIWLSANSVGLLKSPVHAFEQRENAFRYNLVANEFMRKKGIPILDFFQMTDPTMSYDGTHYGRGVTDLKAQVFLNYILEMRTTA